MGRQNPSFFGGRIHDVITHARFGDARWRGWVGCGVKVQHFPLTLLVVLTTLTLVWACIEVNQHIKLASAAFALLSHCVFCNQNLIISIKVAVYNAVCVSVLFFGCETWMLYRQRIKALEAYMYRAKSTENMWSSLVAQGPSCRDVMQGQHSLHGTFTGSHAASGEIGWSNHSDAVQPAPMAHSVLRTAACRSWRLSTSATTRRQKSAALGDTRSQAFLHRVLVKSAAESTHQNLGSRVTFVLIVRLFSS